MLTQIGPSDTSDPWQAIVGYGVSGPLIAALVVWLRLTQRERDKAMEKATELSERLLAQEMEVVAMVDRLTALLERVERRLDG